jgi:hypothetical protein
MNAGGPSPQAAAGIRRVDGFAPWLWQPSGSAWCSRLFPGGHAMCSSHSPPDGVRRDHAPTFEKANRVVGLVDFLRRWEHKDELKCQELRFAVADGGNINLRGTSECSESFLLTRWHPSFAASIEAGVRELVIRLVPKQA